MTFATIKDLALLARQWPAPATLLALLVVIAWIVWAWPLGGMARADELDAVKASVTQLNTDLNNLKIDVKDGRIEGLEGQLFEARVAQCRAETDELKEVYGRRVANLQSQYRKLTNGDDMNLPNCIDL